MLLAALPVGWTCVLDTTVTTFFIQSTECDFELTLIRRGVAVGIVYIGFISNFENTKLYSTMFHKSQIPIVDLYRNDNSWTTVGLYISRLRNKLLWKKERYDNGIVAWLDLQHIMGPCHFILHFYTFQVFQWDSVSMPNLLLLTRNLFLFNSLNFSSTALPVHCHFLYPTFLNFTHLRINQCLPSGLIYCLHSQIYFLQVELLQVLFLIISSFTKHLNVHTKKIFSFNSGLL